MGELESTLLEFHGLKSGWSCSSKAEWVHWFTRWKANGLWVAPGIDSLWEGLWYSEYHLKPRFLNPSASSSLLVPPPWYILESPLPLKTNLDFSVSLAKALSFSWRGIEADAWKGSWERPIWCGVWGPFQVCPYQFPEGREWLHGVTRETRH